MRILNSLILLVFFAGIALAPSISIAEVLTNDSVVMMVKAKLGEDLIISKIKSSQNQFDLSTATILKLKDEGVSEKIIQAMIENTGTSGGAEQKPGGAGPVDPLAGALGVPTVMMTNGSSLFVKLPDRVGEIVPIVAEIQHSMAKHFIPYYFGPGDTWHFLRGPKSAIRIGERTPTFFTKINPSNFLLVKLEYQAEHDIRYVVETGSAYRNTLPIAVNRKSDALFELTPKGQLQPGEYAFVSSGTFYDFGIE